MTRIVLVDDHAMMRDGLRALLAREPSVEVVGEASNGRDAIVLVNDLQPDVVVMDITMPELNGVDATRRITADSPEVRVIALSMNSDRRYVVAMFDVGAKGYLLKDAASGELVTAIHAVMNDQVYVSPKVAAGVVESALKSRPASTRGGLSPREREVLQLLAEGKTSKEIAARLNLAVPTVETHRRQIMGKLNIRTIAELTKYAVREGLTGLEK